MGVIIISRLRWAPIQWPGCRSPHHPPISAGLLSLVEAAAVSNSAKALGWDWVMQGSGLSTGGRLPDSRKPGPDGVGWGGKGPGKASWTVAQCGDCLSAQALGHAATPPWARAPALGFQRDVTGGLAFPLHCRIPAPPTASPKPPLKQLSAPTLSQPPNAPPTAFLFQP